MKKTFVFSTRDARRRERRQSTEDQIQNQSMQDTPPVVASHAHSPRLPVQPQIQQQRIGHRRKANPVVSTSSPSSIRRTATIKRSAIRGSVTSPSTFGSKTVEKLRPSPALLQSDRISVAKCVKTMAEKQCEATLLVNENGMLTGILTDSDLAFKVVAMGLNPRLVLVSEVMTRNPLYVSPNASAIDALKQMLRGRFRHLPVVDEGKVVGILDVTKCFYDAILKVERTPECFNEFVKTIEKQIPSTGAKWFEKMREKLLLLTLSAIIQDREAVPRVRTTASAMDASKVMLQHKKSAVIVDDGDDDVTGIVTSKDLLRRVVACDLDPAACVVAAIMTPKPSCAKVDSTVLDTLHSMHRGKFLHLPVVDHRGKVVALVDVLQITLKIVQQMGTFPHARNESIEPLWNQFRSIALRDLPQHQHESRLGDVDTDADVGEDTRSERSSESGSWGRASRESREPPRIPRIRAQSENPISSANDDTQSVSSSTSSAWEKHLRSQPHSENPAGESCPDVFVYRLADCNGNNHRFTSSAESVRDLLLDVQNRLGDYTIRQVHYVDDEGEHVILFSDSDLRDAVARARTWGCKYIKLVVPFVRTQSRVSKKRSVDPVAHEHTIGYAVAMTVAAIAGLSVFLTRRK